MPRRLALILALLVLAAPAAPALAQDGNPFDGRLPPAQPTPVAVPESQDTSDDDVGRATLYAIGGALLVFFVFIGWWISRDARGALPAGHRPTERKRDEGPHRHERMAKAKARDKARAQRQARKKSRAKR